MARSTLRSLADHFEDLPDPRLNRNKEHALLDILVLGMCALLAGCDSWVDVERFGRANLDWFRTFLRLPNGILSHDTFGQVFALLNTGAFGACFTAWMTAACATLGLKHVAIDGNPGRNFSIQEWRVTTTLVRSRHDARSFTTSRASNT